MLVKSNHVLHTRYVPQPLPLHGKPSLHGHYFTSDTAFIFLDGQHSFDSRDLVQVNNVRYNLHDSAWDKFDSGQLAGPEETVMQSILSLSTAQEDEEDSSLILVITRPLFRSYNHYTVWYPHDGVFLFTNVGKLFFHKNSIQFMSGIWTQG